jgi:hypothetical protein
MMIKYQWIQSVRFALAIGVVLASFVSTSMFYETELYVWLLVNNSLVVTSLLLAFLIGYRLRRSGSSIFLIVGHVTVFYGIVACLYVYVGSYAVMTYFFADRLAWMPFFHRDYTYHGFQSVREYMDHKDNFVDLLVLQIFSCVICSALYFSAGIAGSFFSTFTTRGSSHSSI